MKKGAIIALFIFNFMLSLQASTQCPAPFKSDDLFCLLKKLSTSTNDGESSNYESTRSSTRPSVPSQSMGVINQIAQGPNNLIRNTQCAVRRVAEIAREQEDERRVERERDIWRDFTRNDRRPADTGSLSEVAQRENQSQPPGNSSAVNVELKDGDPETDGFYRYGPDWKKFGTEKTIWQIEEAGKKLVEADLVMGVGNISKRGGGQLPPHQTHREGKNVDLRFLNSEGRAQACTIHQSCYDREKTGIMLETIINVDPDNLKTVYVNDPVLRREMQSKFPNIYFSECAGHDNHLHLTFNE